MHRSIAFFLFAAIILISSSAPALAQLSPGEQQKRAEKMEKVKVRVRQLGLGERVRVGVELYDKTKFKGYVKEANENDFVIVDKNGSPQVVRYADVRSIGGKNLSTGAKIGIGIAIGAGAVLAILGLLIANLDD